MRQIRRLGALGVGLLVSACQGATEPMKMGTEQPVGVYTVAGIEPNLAVSDLAPLKGIVGNAQVVGLGESVHTSGGFTAAKLRLTRFLVDEMGFRAVALEVTRENADEAARYAEECQGQPVEAARRLGVWADANTRDLMSWMCERNRAHADDPVRFVGFDTQEPWADGRALHKVLAVAQEGPMLAGLVEGCDGIDSISPDDYHKKHGTGQKVEKGAFEQCWVGLSQVEGYLAAHETELADKSAKRAVDDARLAVVGLRGWEQQRYYESTNPMLAMEGRDLAMAETLLALRAQRFPAGRAVIWAHNEHVALAHDAITGSLADGARGMGGVLRAKLGAGYVAVGLTGWDVEINWPGVGCGPVAAHPAGDSVEGVLHALKSPYLLVDLSFAGAAKPLLARDTEYQFAGSERLVPSDQFHALFYLERSAPSESLLWSCE